MSIKTKALDTKDKASQAQVNPVFVDELDRRSLPCFGKNHLRQDCSGLKQTGNLWLERSADTPQMLTAQCQGDYEKLSCAEMATTLKSQSTAGRVRPSRQPIRWERFFEACPVVIVFALHSVRRWLPWQVRLAHGRIYLKAQRASFMKKLKADLKQHYLKERRRAASKLTEAERYD